MARTPIRTISIGAKDLLSPPPPAAPAAPAAPGTPAPAPGTPAPAAPGTPAPGPSQTNRPTWSSTPQNAGAAPEPTEKTGLDTSKFAKNTSISTRPYIWKYK